MKFKPTLTGKKTVLSFIFIQTHMIVKKKLRYLVILFLNNPYIFCADCNLSINTILKFILLVIFEDAGEYKIKTKRVLRSAIISSVHENAY
jgi:hypothetical protein